MAEGKDPNSSELENEKDKNEDPARAEYFKLVDELMAKVDPKNFPKEVYGIGMESLADVVLGTIQSFRERLEREGNVNFIQEFEDCRIRCEKFMEIAEDSKKRREDDLKKSYDELMKEYAELVNPDRYSKDIYGDLIKEGAESLTSELKSRYNSNPSKEEKERLIEFRYQNVVYFLYSASVFKERIEREKKADSVAKKDFFIFLDKMIADVDPEKISEYTFGKEIHDEASKLFNYLRTYKESIENRPVDFAHELDIFKKGEAKSVEEFLKNAAHSRVAIHDSGFQFIYSTIVSRWLEDNKKTHDQLTKEDENELRRAAWLVFQKQNPQEAEKFQAEDWMNGESELSKSRAEEYLANKKRKNNIEKKLRPYEIEMSVMAKYAVALKERLQEEADWEGYSERQKVLKIRKLVIEAVTGWIERQSKFLDKNEARKVAGELYKEEIKKQAEMHQ